MYVYVSAYGCLIMLCVPVSDYVYVSFVDPDVPVYVIASVFVYYDSEICV